METVLTMANLRDIDPKLRALQGRLITRVDMLSDRLEAGEITANQWERLMSELIAEGTGKAYRIGKGGNVS